MKLNKYACFLDRGHSDGNNKDLAVKEYKHHTGLVKEGTLNQVICNNIKSRMCVYRDIDIIEIPNQGIDYPLKYRTDYANWRSKFYEKSIYMSIHHNAFDDGAANGGECFIGSSSDSNRLGLLFQEHYKDLSPLKWRGIKSGNYHVTRETNMPAIIAEWGFYDNYEEYLKLIASMNIEIFGEISERTIIDYFYD